MNEKAIQTWYEKYGSMVYARCLYILKDEDKAFDTMQEVFIKLIRRKSALPIRVLANYLYSVATTTSIDLLKKQHNIIVNSELLESVVDNQKHEEAIVDRLSFEKFLSQLDRKDRMIILLTHQQKMLQQEIAEITGISVSAIKKRLNKIRKAALLFKEYLDE